MDTKLAVLDEDLEKTITVLQRKFENPELTVVELCEEVELDRRQYYRKLSEGKEVIQVLRELINKSKRIQLATIAVGKHEILTNMIDGVLKTDDLDMMVKVSKYLDEHEENLQNDLGAKPGLEDEARDFLKKGPTISKQESKFASIRISEDNQGDVQVDIFKEHDVLDITPIDQED